MRPVLIDVVSGEIKPLEWKQGTSDTLEALPIKDSIMAVSDESYFDWPVLPEAPSSLNVSTVGVESKLTWEVHGGDPTDILVERSNPDKARGAWEEIATLPATAVQYLDNGFGKGQSASYRVRAVNAGGKSAYSNVARAQDH